MTNWKYSQLHALGQAPAPGDLIAILRVSDSETPPADGSGSNQTVTVAELLSAGGTLVAYLAPSVVTLTYGTTIPVNAALGNIFDLTLTGSAGTIANPTNPVDGQPLQIRISQDSTGGRTVAWGSAYDFGAGGTPPVLSTTASKFDIIAFQYKASASKWACLNSGGIGY